MNTSKQVNVMIGLLFVSFVVIVGYLFNESNRQEVETEEITHRNAERGARLFVANCRTCHDLDGSGGIGAAINNKAFWIFQEGNAYGLPATPEGEAEQIRIYLRETIECGRPGTYMATWSQRHGGPLSDTQINHLVTLLTNDAGGKTDFWRLVEVEGEHADEEQYAAVLEKELGRHPTTEEIRERSQAQTVVLDPTALTVNDESCGNWTPTTKAQFRGRDPFSDAPAVVATAAPDEATPPPDVEGAVNVPGRHDGMGDDRRPADPGRRRELPGPEQRRRRARVRGHPQRCCRRWLAYRRRGRRRGRPRYPGAHSGVQGRLGRVDGARVAARPVPAVLQRAGALHTGHGNFGHGGVTTRHTAVTVK